MKATNRNISVGCVVAQGERQTSHAVNEKIFIIVFVSTTNDILNDLNNAISHFMVMFLALQYCTLFRIAFRENEEEDT